MAKSPHTPRAIKRGSLIALATVALSASQPLAVPSQAGERIQTGRSPGGSGDARQSRTPQSPCAEGAACKQTITVPKRGGFTGIPGRPYTGIPGRPYR
jgi:hypothetical protein